MAVGACVEAEDAPDAFHGFTFSNLVDRAWLFGGMPVGNSERRSGASSLHSEIMTGHDRHPGQHRIELGAVLFRLRSFPR
jgi:hypothetical protein